MEAERWQRINDLFLSALEREPAGRSDFIDGACAGDEELRREVESLLAAHEQASEFIRGACCRRGRPVTGRRARRFHGGAAARPLPAYLAARGGWDGRGLPGEGCEAEPPGGDVNLAS